MPKLDLEAIEQTNATGYPPEYAGVVQGRWYRRLAPAAGLSDFGASHVVLEPGGLPAGTRTATPQGRPGRQPAARK